MSTETFESSAYVGRSGIELCGGQKRITEDILRVIRDRLFERKVDEEKLARYRDVAPELDSAGVSKILIGDRQFSFDHREKFIRSLLSMLGINFGAVIKTRLSLTSEERTSLLQVLEVRGVGKMLASGGPFEPMNPDHQREQEDVELEIAISRAALKELCGEPSLLTMG
jgi:hypothetical protein